MDRSDVAKGDPGLMIDLTEMGFMVHQHEVRRAHRRYGADVPWYETVSLHHEPGLMRGVADPNRPALRKSTGNPSCNAASREPPELPIHPEIRCAGNTSCKRHVVREAERVAVRRFDRSGK